ncbi:hypothetical protein [Nonomuraea angiospora]
MSGLEIFLGVMLGLLVNETCDVSPWVARKLVHWAANLQYRDAHRAAIRSEELTALINDRPGKLFKLVTALAFAGHAAVVHIRRAVSPLLNKVARVGVRLMPQRRIKSWSIAVRDGERAEREATLTLKVGRSTFLSTGPREEVRLLYLDIHEALESGSFKRLDAAVGQGVASISLASSMSGRFTRLSPMFRRLRLGRCSRK